MYKLKKTTAILLALVMVFSLALNPLSAVYASAPNPKLPTIGIPTIKPLTKTAPATAPLVKLETPARLQGVNYEFKDEIKRTPTAMKYNFKPLSLDKFASFDLEETTTETNQTTEELLDKINGIKYPAGAKLMTMPLSAAQSFSPNKNEIYIDEEEGTAFRVLGRESQDEEGNMQYVVESPQLTDIFKSYSIPEQTINLTTGNIAYIAPEFELSPDSGMPKNYVAKADGITVFENDYITCTMEGNKHIMTLKENTLLFQYPSEEDAEAAAKDKEQAKKDKFEGDWWEKDQYSDLRGVENESALSVAIRVKEGSIVVEDPKFHASFDINWLTSQLDANFYFDAKATADVTLMGDLTFNYSLEKCVYGYDIDLGKVMGKEKSNKAYIGIFLVLGVNGKIHVEVRTVTTGDARAGFAYKSLGYGSLPYYVGPYATYRPSTFDMSFTVDGEIHATLACVPQVGVIIWGCELGALQIWVGFKSTARFSASGGTDGQEFKASGSIDLRAFGELVGYLIGNRYSIFYIEFPLYSGEWSVGEEASGNGGDMVREVLPHVRVTADAYANKVEGKVAFSTEGKNETGYIGGDKANLDSSLKPYTNSLISLEVYDKDSIIKFSKAVQTDAEGKFSEQSFGNQNILPSDKVCINVQDHMSPEFLIDNNKFRVVGISPKINATVPFSKLECNIDTFNDVITGWVSGNYDGPLKISVDKFIDGNKKVTDIITVNADNGLFKLDYPIDQSTDWVKAYIDFEGSTFMSDLELRNLDALTINLFNDFSEPEESSIQPTVPGAKDIFESTIPIPNAIKEAQDKLNQGITVTSDNMDIAGNKIIKASKITGTITNKGDMGWLESQGDDCVRPGTNSGNMRHYIGSVKINEISVQSALDAMIEQSKDPHADWIPQPRENGYEATTQAQQVMERRVVLGSTDKKDLTTMPYPTAAAKFEFNRPDVAAYIIEIEHEGLTLQAVYNPYEHHYSNNQQSLSDFIGPLREVFTLVTQEKIESVVNPADVMNQWQGSWMTQMGTMQLTQKGTAVTGTIMQGGKALTVEGTASNGVFKGSIMIPSASNLFGDITTFEMNISVDGKSVGFNSIGTDSTIKSLNGTTATRQ